MFITKIKRALQKYDTGSIVFMPVEVTDIIDDSSSLIRRSCVLEATDLYEVAPFQIQPIVWEGNDAYIGNHIYFCKCIKIKDHKWKASFSFLPYTFCASSRRKLRSQINLSYNTFMSSIIYNHVQE